MTFTLYLCTLYFAYCVPVEQYNNWEACHLSGRAIFAESNPAYVSGDYYWNWRCPQSQ